MRLHSLEATAFGPFSGTVTVDFDRLSEAGLFLLSGATGAGKTSVLDAVCFALYGDVPGDRATAKRLRADLAAPDAEPRVTVDATLSGRRFRITRTPAWQRPKRRGSGTTPAQASVRVDERVGGAWTTLATRLDEAGLLVSGLVGMNLTQFMQVAMLPQGRFQTFLRAKSEDRHKLLHQLFRTGRFEAVEGWLRDRRIALRREVETAHRDLADLVSRTSETVGDPLPEGWEPHDLTAPASDGSLHEWATGLRDVARSRAEAATSTLSTAVATEAAARQALTNGRALAERQAALGEARARSAALRAETPELERLQIDIEAATRAAAVRPVARLVTRAEQALAEAQRSTAELDVDREELRSLERAATEAAARVQAALPRELEVRGLTTSIEADEARLAALPALVRAATLHRLIEAGVKHARLAAMITAAREVHLAARATALEAGEALLELRQARIEGMAAELAGGLAVGASCPVCGSAEHPHPAVVAAGSPDAAAERAAAKAVDIAKADEHLAATELRDLETALAVAAQDISDRPVDQLRAELAELGVPDGSPDTDELTTERARLEAALATRCAQRDLARAEVAAVLAGHDSPDLATLLRYHQGAARTAAEAGRALDALADAARAHEEAAASLAEALTEHGFASRADAAAAALPPDQVERAVTRLREHDRRLASVTAVLTAADAAEVEAAPSPDVEALGAAHAAALHELGSARAVAESWAARAVRLDDLTRRLIDALAQWQPRHDEWRLTAELSAFCEGKSADNRLQMRLSAYVLAYRLSQVVAAANERLAGMSDQRYTLEHTGRAGAGETRGGLSLLVRDDWSGESRDPATLSGGETFVVSLALALGLADVITQEAGGADLDTLFVDEGFGSLDADTLDDVLDTLDALRDGGRVVGVVSHVAEMRDRIPCQLVVTKARGGSTLSVRG
ncbi:MAG TPA: SMC family ATPase [Nocardioides bacterium]|nr:SMC family ATPase [Nocardioides sp.]